ncbi:MAG: peptidyl-prolyl cis-trans isomerase, partial [Gemmatimonadaceae bacterium]
VPDSAVKVPESELRAFYDKNRESLKRQGKAVVTVLTIPRVVTPADSQASRARAVALREEIRNGAKFEDVAKRESADTISGAQGGSLGSGPKGRFAKPFEDAAFALKTGEVSQPVLTTFGYHLIRVDSRKGDTLSLRHIMVRIQQSDSSAVHTDRLADSLARIAAQQEQGSRLDSAAKVLGLKAERMTVVEGEPLMSSTGRPIPSVSAWAFGAVKVGETSDLYDSDDGYFLARLDSVTAGGIPSFDQVRGEIQSELIGRRKAESLVPKAKELAAAAASSTLEAAATAKGVTVTKSDVFTRPQFVAGLGRFNAAIGASFTLPQGSVSQPIVTDEGAFVIRVDRRAKADSAVWAAQKDKQRQEASSSLRQLKVRTFLNELRKGAKVEDNRKQINAAARQQSS